MTRAIVLVSGGLDSTVALYWAHKEYGGALAALSFDYSQRHARELLFAAYHCVKLHVPHRVIHLPWFSDFRSSALTNPELPVPHIRDVLGHPQPVTYVPFRNLLLLTIGAQYAEEYGAEDVVYGAQLHDLYGYWDAAAEFVRRLNAVFELNRLARIRVVAPLAGNSKGDNVKLGLQLGVDFTHTWSCYKGLEKHCGSCPTCAERRKAFVDAGVPDPTVYADEGR
jgi:7-cyano-7-deazaguanine synthase